VRSDADIREVFRLRAVHGWGAPRIAAATGVSATQVRRWLRHDLQDVLDSPMRRLARCGQGTCLAAPVTDEAAYAYLLGQYLGDGSIVRVGRSERLEVSTTATWPGIRAEVMDALETVIGRQANTRREHRGVVRVVSYSKHWPCLFPQHGPGRKHHRAIRLDAWQEAIALDRHPGRLLRGLVHSDGWRGINTVHRPGRAEPYRYAPDTRSRTAQTTSVRSSRPPATSSGSNGARPADGRFTSLGSRPSRGSTTTSDPSTEVPGAGFEPARPCGQWILSPPCQPIAPSGRVDERNRQRVFPLR